MLLTPSCYPALGYYSQDIGLETTWAKIDLLLKLCLSGVVSEENAYQTVKDGMNNRLNEDGQRDTSYLQKMERECCQSRLPSMAEWELRSLVLRVYSGLRPPERAQESPLYKLVDALQKSGVLCGVLTFNYDLSLETLCRPQFYYPLLENTPSDMKLPLMKLHGSLNWQETPPKICLVDGVARMQYQNGMWTQPSVIGPTFFKQEITIDYQKDYRAIHYKRLWRFAWDLLSQARRIIFVGFSFPSTDFHVAALFRTAHLAGPGFQSAVVCHQNDQNVCSAIERVFAGRPVKFSCFPQGLGNMVERVDEVMSLLQ